MTVRKIDSKEKTKKRGNPNWVKGGKSPHPEGRGPDGSSMRAAYEWAMSLTPDVVAEILSINGSNELSRQFKQMPRGIQLKLLVALRIVSAIMFEPQAAMVNHFVDRIDGPVKNEQEHSGAITINVNYADASASASSATDDQT